MKYPYTNRHLSTILETSNELEIKRAWGCRYLDDSNREYLNLNDISCVLGYRYPKFVSRVSNNILNYNLGHISNYSNEKEKLIIRLFELTNNNFDKIFFAGSGGEIVDYSIKLARRTTKKDTIVSFNNSLHGRSFAGAYLSGVPTRKEGFGTGLSNVIFWDFPKKDEEFKYSNVDAKDIAGIIIEPLQALGGMVVPTKKYWKELREYCDLNNIVLIFDEIQTGFGKTGTLFFYEKTGIIPDILLMGKGMSNGFGMGGLLMNKKVADSIKPVEMSGGSADNEFMCSVVNAVLDIFEEDKVLENVNKSGSILKEGIDKLINENKIDGELNGDGLFLSLKTKDADIILNKLKDRGIILGKKDDNILFRPPLIISEEEVNKVINELEK